MSKLAATEISDVQRSYFCAHKILPRKNKYVHQKGTKNQILLFQAQNLQKYQIVLFSFWRSILIQTKLLAGQWNSDKNSLQIFNSSVFIIDIDYRDYTTFTCNPKKYETTKHQYCEFSHNFTHLVISFSCVLWVHIHICTNEPTFYSKA